MKKSDPKTRTHKDRTEKEMSDRAKPDGYDLSPEIKEKLKSMNIDVC